MSYIIKGILGGQLPWGLVLLGVFISIVLELSGIPSLAFAVGVYLPISTSAPVWVGGLIRGLRRQLHASQARRRELHRRSARCRRRQEQWSPLVIRLHRGRDPGRSRFRLLEYSVERHLRHVRKMGDRTQSILRRPARRSARDDSVRCAVRPTLSRRPRCSVHAESEAHELGIRLRFLSPRQVHWNPGQHD